MALIIAVVNTKGGVGKSTVVVELAVRAAELGYRSVLIEADDQTTCSGWLEAIDQTGNESGVEYYVLENVDRGARSLEVNALVKQLRGECDIIFIDTKGDATLETSAAVNLSDFALIPIQPSANDLEEFERTVGLIYTSREIRQGKPAATIVLNLTSDNDRLIPEVKALAKSCKLPVARTNLKRLIA